MLAWLMNVVTSVRIVVTRVLPERWPKPREGAWKGPRLLFTLHELPQVLIVFVNKVLMDPKKGHGFVFGKQQLSR